MARADYTRTTYVGGTTPAINSTNLNNIENKVNELDKLVPKYGVETYNGDVMNGLSTLTKTIDIGVTGIKGVCVFRSTSNHIDYVWMFGNDAPNESTSNMYNYGVTTYLSAQYYDNTGNNIRIKSCYLLSTSIVIIFENPTASNKTLYAQVRYQVDC
jgi:hypothetical protein